ncbi:hypothetical protein HL653_20320 [Sphingomonas sp. AP4-R1]|uniref:hypothetical protein n=1 Tax=Sphingomonas sp. AP4-R1 TaxID=2735134 RepID=UPI0014933585|nr:hypothetical protein [Sphingomonas sp. AP4-R1]QJU59783.1 hypothetical protein HL653_20320 [Sphingomonas sp. AP4-R1]
MRTYFHAVPAALALVMTSIPAQAACWNEQEVSAGTIRDFQSMLMVATLRCQVMHIDITGDYNGFLRANKATIQTMNERLKVHFLKADGPVEGQRHYDAFATGLANAYGSRQGKAEMCATVAALQREAAMMAGSEEGLVLLAHREGIATALPEGACGVARTEIAMVVPAAPAGPGGPPSDE